MKTRVLLAMLAVVIIAGHRRPPVTAVEPSDAQLLSRLDLLERQAAILSQSMDEVTTKYYRDVRPIETALLRRASRPDLAKAAAWAVVREAESRHLSPALVAAVLQVENPWLAPDTVSYAGAVGLMQVMPFHVSDNHPCGVDLTDGDTNVCYGADILRSYLGRALDDALRVALLRYNGCVRTPGCERYAAHVTARLDR
jgi:soluble lytic murein transglycosylase-like protein